MAAGLLSGALVTGCGGGTASPSVAGLHDTDTSTSSVTTAATATTTHSRTSAGGGTSQSTVAAPADPQSAGLAYSKCMRAHGVPNFPDPRPGGGFVFSTGAGLDPSSPQFEAAEAACAKLMPTNGLAPGSQTHPSQQALAQMLRVAQCMRRHGVPDFPEPRTSIPPDIRSALGGHGVISDIDGVVLVFPGTIDEQSPLFTRAASTCAFPLHNH